MAEGQKNKKGKGAHAAKKAKHATHCLGSSIKGKNKKKTGGVITMKNKAARAQKHQKLLSNLQDRKLERLSLLEEVLKTSTLKIVELTRKYGTLNIRRLTDILNGNAENSMWYKARVAKKEAVLLSARVVRKHVKFNKRRKEKVSSKVQGVSGRGTPRNRSVQVDQE